MNKLIKPHGSVTFIIIYAHETWCLFKNKKQTGCYFSDLWGSRPAVTTLLSCHMYFFLKLDTGLLFQVLRANLMKAYHMLLIKTF